jgi:hypothetical protein
MPFHISSLNQPTPNNACSFKKINCGLTPDRWPEAYLDTATKHAFASRSADFLIGMAEVE